jgi:hypothetical protein
MESHFMDDNSFPGFDHVYWLTEPGSDIFRTGADMSIPEAFALSRAELSVERPVVLRWKMGRKVPGDFVWTAMAVLIVVSDKVVSVLKTNFCSGWSTYPVHLYGPLGNRIVGYHGLAVRGRCGPRQPERSAHTVVVDDKIGPRPSYRGLFFDESSWDGSDIFVPSDGSAQVFLLERVKNLLLQAKIKGARFERADQYERRVR